eukprot:332964-Hanusia_phi.AAC.2
MVPRELGTEHRRETLISWPCTESPTRPKLLLASRARSKPRLPPNYVHGVGDFSLQGRQVKEDRQGQGGSTRSKRIELTMWHLGGDLDISGHVDLLQGL